MIISYKLLLILAHSWLGNSNVWCLPVCILEIWQRPVDNRSSSMVGSVPAKTHRHLVWRCDSYRSTSLTVQYVIYLIWTLNITMIDALFLNSFQTWLVRWSAFFQNEIRNKLNREKLWDSYFYLQKTKYICVNSLMCLWRLICLVAARKRE